MKAKGIDISHYQGEADLQRVKEAGYSFVIINAGYGRYLSQKDKYFERNYSKARAAGLGVGAYWYSYAKTAAEAKAEAKVFLEAVAGKEFDYPLCYDIEDSSQAGLSAKVIGDMVNAFCGELEAKGYYACIYSYASFLTEKVPAACREKYDVWVANFDVAKPSYSGVYGMWQYTSRGQVPGISGSCDCDYAYRDYPAIMRERGLNGYSAPGAEPLDTAGFSRGDKSDGVLALKQLLLIARAQGLTAQKVDNNSSFGSGTEKAVNGLLGAWGCARNGIAGERFIKRLGEELR